MTALLPSRAREQAVVGKLMAVRVLKVDCSRHPGERDGLIVAPPRNTRAGSRPERPAQKPIEHYGAGTEAGVEETVHGSIINPRL